MGCVSTYGNSLEGSGEGQGLSMMVLTVRPQEGPSRRAEKKPGWV